MQKHDEQTRRRDQRKTVDLCGHAERSGARCVLERGHDGSHESPLHEGTLLRWANP
jgi:hypothetical protein